ncbi:cation-translocating P-type ATPase [Nocardia aurantiaca]|uniref:HAD-IC family P-type ATPase n=1 Tax=Nocardia aurantiaca TaxID=2675850 RepID=A0A6I3L446_9NOCA|nr:cation-translocating P-type ATPase [Nocardia aurantiaca]MTE15710.1 HAD-IC family P-type ATPase [Nocardia aurantiaca]
MLSRLIGLTTGTARGLTRSLGTVAEIGAQLRHDLGTLLDPGLHRDRRVARVGDRVFVEVHGLGSERGPKLAAAVREALRAVPGVEHVRTNSITGQVVVTTDTDIPDLVEAVAAIERDFGLSDRPWDPTTPHPGDLEPALSAAISLLSDTLALGLAVAGAVTPQRAPVQFFQATAAILDTQPRLRAMLEQRIGPARTDLLVTTANAIGQAAGEGVGSLLVDAGQRALVLAEAGTRHVRWRQWELAAPRFRPHSGPREPLRIGARPVELPPGPVEQCADEVATGSALATATALFGRGTADAAPALGLAAPKAARTSRESFAAAVAIRLALAGVLTVDPGVWRRLDRLSAIVIDGEVLLGTHRLVLDAEAADSLELRRIWSAAQDRLWTTDDADSTAANDDSSAERPLRLVEKEQPEPDGPVWHEVHDDTGQVGRVLVGHELHPRAQAILLAARDAGLRVILVGTRDATELRSSADEFVSRTQSRHDLVRRLQEQGHGVAVISASADRALAAADAAIGVVRYDRACGRRSPWAADALCTDLVQVLGVLAAIAPARNASARGRALALSAASLGGLLVAAAPQRHNEQLPVTAAQATGLLTGGLSGWRATHSDLDAADAPLLPWHGLQAREVLTRLPEPEPPAETSRPNSFTPILDRATATAGPFTRFAGHLRAEVADPLTPILGVGAAASAILGAPTDALLVSSVVTVNAVVSTVQRLRAESALRDLLHREQLRACRIDRREALQRSPGDLESLAGHQIPADDLHVGDIVLVRTGDVVPADARMLCCDDLEIDESALTGESVTVEKRVAATPGAALSERYCMLFRGSTVVNGIATAVVVAVGADTEAERAAAAAIPPRRTGVQAQLRRLTDQALPTTLAGGSAVTALGWLRGRPLRSALAEGVAVATAAVPEGLPLVATVAQSAAARRLSHSGILVRASRTVEALGRVDTVCFDKTGTLTEGRLRLTALASLDREWEPGDADPVSRRLLRDAAHACPDPDGPIVHSTDRAVLDAAAELPADEGWETVQELPFESNRGFAATLGHNPRRLRLVVKGAPEVVLDRCARVRHDSGNPSSTAFSDTERKRADHLVHELAGRGLRVLVVARRDLRSAPDDIEGAVEKLTLIGFLGLADTPRPQARPLITALRHNEISARIITGDHPVTAAAVARELGIEAATVTTGAELDELDESDQAELISKSMVFARVSPRHKVRIVSTLQQDGHVVAMAGDGGNDAAAIRTADIGIGLAARGSTAARNAADLVLTDPDPLVVLEALAEGRSMWRRVSDAVGVLVGGNAGEVAFTVLGTAVAGRAPLGTRQFLLVNLLTDMFPAMAVAVSPDPATEEAAESPGRAEELGARLAARPPADPDAELLNAILSRGAATAAGATGAWLIGRYTGTARRASTMGLVALIGTQLGQTLLAGRHSPLVWFTTAASGAVLVTIVMTPGICGYFGCRPLGPVGWAIAGGAAGIATAISAFDGRHAGNSDNVKPT